VRGLAGPQAQAIRGRRAAGVAAERDLPGVVPPPTGTFRRYWGVATIRDKMGHCLYESFTVAAPAGSPSPRYYEPLRHPKRPGLALTGLRLSTRDSPLGASRVASDLRVQACRRQYLGGTPGAWRIVRGYPLCLPGRRPSPYSNWVGSRIGLFRGLHGVHCRCSLSARRAARGGPLSRRPRRFRYLHRRSDSYRRERPVVRAGIAPAGDPGLGTAHCYRNPKMSRAMMRLH
jgi:hypothetical protein